MTDNEIIKELTDIAVIMAQLGDLRKAAVIREALKLINRNKTAFEVDEFAVMLAESMFTKRELARLYVKTLTELEVMKNESNKNRTIPRDT